MITTERGEHLLCTLPPFLELTRSLHLQGSALKAALRAHWNDHSVRILRIEQSTSRPALPHALSYSIHRLSDLISIRQFAEAFSLLSGDRVRSLQRG